MTTDDYDMLKNLDFDGIDDAPTEAVVANKSGYYQEDIPAAVAQSLLGKNFDNNTAIRWQLISDSTETTVVGFLPGQKPKAYKLDESTEKDVLTYTELEHLVANPYYKSAKAIERTAEATRQHNAIRVCFVVLALLFFAGIALIVFSFYKFGG